MREIAEVSLSELIDRYQVFFLDQFGVLRDDQGAYPGAAEALQQLKAIGKTVVILSNSGRSGDFNAARFVKLGFPRESFDYFVTSGDAAYAVLSKEGSPLSRDARCLTISSGGDRNLAERMGMINVDDAAEANLVIISGSEAERIPMESYANLLRPAAMRGIPAICTNPDIQKLADGAVAPGAGAIAELYEQLGGTVRWFGKPYQDIYELAMRLCGDVSPQSVICVGDSLDHDILGASRFGLDSVLVRTGLAGQSTATGHDDMKTADVQPTYMMSQFR
ncbi:TIGR01459 family HAD-type hydrolase [Neorhizobium lilium]|uniref:TIGR01459 family HAD-type hydrolase n=2 Tax=Neorhizobium lilium TaxID=2503024 RepID=A0A3S3SI31_9HYPH|nr:TIGR01459 family HAD-type hydrolase [Neorhizobium lilium]RWX80993.1 TIGR01459 family HAD-type hydrolase [Neorhizobium lilium]